MRARGVLSVLGVIVCMACDDGPEPQDQHRVCKARGGAAAVLAVGTVTVANTGRVFPMESGEAFVVTATPELFRLELCSPEKSIATRDAHVLMEWHVAGPAPQDVSTLPPGSYFEAEQKGTIGSPVFIFTEWETVGVPTAPDTPPLAIPGEGQILVYDLTMPHFVAHMALKNGWVDAKIDVDITWTAK